MSGVNPNLPCDSELGDLGQVIIDLREESKFVYGKHEQHTLLIRAAEAIEVLSRRGVRKDGPNPATPAAGDATKQTPAEIAIAIVAPVAHLLEGYSKGSDPLGHLHEAIAQAIREASSITAEEVVLPRIPKLLEAMAAVEHDGTGTSLRDIEAALAGLSESDLQTFTIGEQNEAQAIAKRSPHLVRCAALLDCVSEEAFLVDLNDRASQTERLADALDQLRCPDCKCADQIDAGSSECGCASLICGRDGSKTLAQFAVEQHGHLHELLKVAAAYVNLCDQLMPQLKKPLPGINRNYKTARATAEKAMAFIGLPGRLDDWIRSNLDAEHVGAEER